MDAATGILYEGSAAPVVFVVASLAVREPIVMKFPKALTLGICLLAVNAPFLLGQATPSDPIPILPPATLGPQLIVWSQLQPQPVPEPLPKSRDTKERDKKPRTGRSDPDHRQSVSNVKAEDRVTRISAEW